MEKINRIAKKSFLDKIASGIVKGRWVIGVLFLALIVVSIVMIPKTEVNYNLSTYLPKNSDTTKAVEIMNSEFGDQGIASVMIKEISEEEAQTIYTQLAAIEGVQSITYLPETDYKDNSAIFSIVTSAASASPQTEETIVRIVDFIRNYDAYIIGQSYANYAQKEEVNAQITSVGIIIIVLILLVLILTSKSFFEIVPILLTCGIAALINMGTNFLLGSVSYISNSISIILQLALSIDYSVILLHRFMEERQLYAPAEAAKKALARAVPELLSSSLTTIAGLCSLMLMTLGIGMDLGLALSKGILISLACVILVMPCFFILFAKVIEKTKHRAFLPKVTKPFRAVLKARKIIVPVFLAVIVAAFSTQLQNRYSFQMNTSAYDANVAAVSETFGTQNTLAVLIPKEHYEKERNLIRDISEHAATAAVTGFTTVEIMPGLGLADSLTAAQAGILVQTLGLSQQQIEMLYQAYIAENDPDTTIPLNEYKIMLADLTEYIASVSQSWALPAELVRQLERLTSVRTNFEGKTYARIIVKVNAEIESEQSYDFIDFTKSKISEYYSEYYVTGESVVNYEMYRAFPSDNLKVSLVTIAFLFVILLLTFRNFGIPFILLLTILGGTWLNFSMSVIFATPISFIGYLLVSAIQMGATIDYAILLTNRYRQMKCGFRDPKVAMAEAVNAVFPTILTSGIILTFTGIILGILNASGVVSSLGYMLGRGTFFSMLMVLFVLPSFLVISDKILDKLYFGKRKNTCGLVAAEEEESSVQSEGEKNIAER